MGEQTVKQLAQNFVKKRYEADDKKPWSWWNVGAPAAGAGTLGISEAYRLNSRQIMDWVLGYDRATKDSDLDKVGKMVADWLKPEGLSVPVDLNENMKNLGGKVWMPNEHRDYKHGRILVNTPRPEIALHEAGHIMNRKLLDNRLWLRFTLDKNSSGLGNWSIGASKKLLGKPRLGAALRYAPAVVAAGDSKDGFIGRNAWTVPALAGAPVLLSEGSASLRALTRLIKANGFKAGLKGAPALTAAFLTYGSKSLGPAVAALLANRLKPKINRE